MEKADFLDQLITTYSYDEVDIVYELCLFYYISQTGHVLSDESKNALKFLIDQRPSLAKIRDSVYTIIDIHHGDIN